MTHYSAFRKEAYQDGALSQKVKRLIALAVGLQAGCPRCIIGQTKDAVAAGATKAEVLEAVSVGIVMGGTAVSAESWRVVKVLEELGHGSSSLKATLSSLLLPADGTRSIVRRIHQADATDFPRRQDSAGCNRRQLPPVRALLDPCRCQVLHRRSEQF